MGKVFFLLILICIFLFVVIKGNIDNKKNIEKNKREFKKNFGKENTRVWKSGDLDRISYYAKHRSTEQTVDDLTWNDLDMDLIYRQMAYTQSSLGDDYLYYLLKNPVKEELELEEREKKIACLSLNQDVRLNLRMLFFGLGHMERFSLAQYLEFLMKEKPGKNGKHYVVDIFIVCSILLMVFHVGLGLMLLFSLILYNVVSYFKDKSYFEPYLVSVRYLFKVLDCAKEIRKELPIEWMNEKEELNKILDVIRSIRKNSYLVMSPGRMAGEGLELILDYLRMCLHLDIIKFNRMLTGLQQYEKELWSLYEILGKIDAYIAVAQYREYLSKTCCPVFVQDKVIEMVEGYHPLIENPVCNSIKVDKCVLLTGSNASGKSTFLKTMAVNVLMAQTIHTCMAKEFKLPFCKLLTSMSLKDSLSMKESYYMAEIKAIKRILDAEASEDMIVCMVDEVLRGTNTVERIAASTQILKGMNGKRILCFAATHDVELTKTLDNEYDNYHFEESLVKGDVQFSYKIKFGKANTSNAIDLLANLGYDDKIVDKARDMVKRFETQGEWICE